MYKLVIFF